MISICRRMANLHNAQYPQWLPMSNGNCRSHLAHTTECLLNIKAPKARHRDRGYSKIRAGAIPGGVFSTSWVGASDDRADKTAYWAAWGVCIAHGPEL